jgi:hypothetical protein
MIAGPWADGGCGKPLFSQPLSTVIHPSPRLILLLTLLLGPAAAAQEEPAPTPPPAPGERLLATVPTLEITRTEAAPVIDGLLDDEAWADAPVIDDLRQVEPVEGGPPSERTEIRVLFDADFLYVAFRCFDREPELIRATQMKRDTSLGADDRVSFVVDPFFDRRNAFFFEMNAVGARGDALIEDNTRFRRDWDGIWYGRATIDDGGWNAEMAIPFKTLSFDPATTRWSFNALRFIRRHNENLRWASPSQDVSFNSIANAGIIEGIHDIRQGAGVDVKPYGLSTFKRDHDRDRDGIDVDAGFDIFYKFTPELTLALTVNTDFAETEVDERRVNLTRFPLFFPEKRDFFLQDAGIFNFGGIRRNPLPFQSRRIGLGPNGETIDILAGVKLTGRVEGLNVGLLDVQMKHDSELGNKNYFVGRASLNVLEQSTIGGIFTYGDPSQRGDNYLGGVDFNFRDETEDGKTLEGAAWFQHSESTDVSGDSAYGAKFGYPNDRIDWEVGFTQIDDDFDAALGFVPRRGIREYFGNWRYRWRPDSDLIRRIDAGARMFIVTDLDGQTESRSIDWNLLEIETEEDDTIEINYEAEREVLTEDFEISDGVIIPPGNYHFNRYGVTLESSQARPISVDLGYEGGDFYSGTRDDYEVELQWRVSRHLFLSGEFEMNDIDLPEGDFITRVIRGRVEVFFTPDLSWSTFAQYDNDSESVGLNSRVRWIIEPGNELFLVLNQAIDRDGTSYRVTNTEMTTKVSWTFRF